MKNAQTSRRRESWKESDRQTEGAPKKAGKNVNVDKWKAEKQEKQGEKVQWNTTTEMPAMDEGPWPPKAACKMPKKRCILSARSREPGARSRDRAACEAGDYATQAGNKKGGDPHSTPHQGSQDGDQSQAASWSSVGSF